MCFGYAYDMSRWYFYEVSRTLGLLRTALTALNQQNAQYIPIDFYIIISH